MSSPALAPESRKRKVLDILDTPEEARQAKCPRNPFAPRVFHIGITSRDDRLHKVVANNTFFVHYRVTTVEEEKEDDTITRWTFTEVPQETKEKEEEDLKLVKQKLVAGNEILGLFKRDEDGSEHLYLNEFFITIEEFAKSFGALGTDCGTTTTVYYARGGSYKIYESIQKLGFAQVTKQEEEGVDYDDEGDVLCRYVMFDVVEDVCKFSCPLPNCDKTHFGSTEAICPFPCANLPTCAKTHGIIAT